MAVADVFENWRTAHQQAVAAANELSRKSVRALEGQGELPSAAETEEVRRLRRAANEQFDAAMARIARR